jgi:hypothetical protein
MHVGIEHNNIFAGLQSGALALLVALPQMYTDQAGTGKFPGFRITAPRATARPMAMPALGWRYTSAWTANRINRPISYTTWRIRECPTVLDAHLILYLILRRNPAPLFVSKCLPGRFSFIDVQIQITSAISAAPHRTRQLHIRKISVNFYLVFDTRKKNRKRF